MKRFVRIYKYNMNLGW